MRFHIQGTKENKKQAVHQNMLNPPNMRTRNALTVWWTHPVYKVQCQWMRKFLTVTPVNLRRWNESDEREPVAQRRDVASGRAWQWFWPQHRYRDDTVLVSFFNIGIDTYQSRLFLVPLPIPTVLSFQWMIIKGYPNKFHGKLIIYDYLKSKTLLFDKT